MQPQYPNYDYNAINIERQAHNQQKLIRTVLVVVALCIAFGFLWSLILNKKTVTLKPANGTAISIGTVADDENGGGIRKLLIRTTTEKKIRLKAGTYSILYDGKGYEEERQILELADSVTLKSPELSYSPTKLDELLKSEQKTIRARLDASTSLSGYTPEQEKLYYQGQWYTAQLIPANQVTQDKLVVIMHKEKGTWKIVAGPSIVLWIGAHDDIPEDIIRTVDNQPVTLPGPTS